MRTAGSSDVLEYRRCLAVQRVAEGYSTQEVADFLGVDPSSVRRWLITSRRQGGDGLVAGTGPGPARPPQLTTTQEKIVLRWLADLPTEHGFTTELWSAPRLAQLIEQEFGVDFHPDYLGTGCGSGVTRRKSPGAWPANMITKPLPSSWPKTGRASNRKPAAVVLACC
jgi:transposase